MPFLIPLVLILGFIAAHLLLRPSPSPRPFTIAHRGAAGLAPENTIEGIREAIRLGASHTEIDIRRVADGVLVVMHDRNLKRTTGRDVNVDDLTSAEVTQLQVRSGPDMALSDERIPTLDAVLEVVLPANITLVVEVKDPAIYPGIETLLVEALDRAGMRNRVVVGSFDHAWLPRFRSTAPDVLVTPIADWNTRIPSDPAFKFADVDWRRVVIDPTFVRRMRDQGRRVWVWTVDSPRLMRLMWWLGVDGVTTNRPDLCQSLLQR
jgi:glycerophosphoryl diester phosphodiesterase